MSFAYERASMNFIGYDNQDTLTARLRRRCYTARGCDIGSAISPWQVGAAHGAGYNNRRGRTHPKRQRECSLLKRVSAMGDDDTINRVRCFLYGRCKQA